MFRVRNKTVKKRKEEMMRTIVCVTVLVISALVWGSGQAADQGNSVSLSWKFKEVEFTWTTEFKSKDLQDYRSRTRPRTIDYSIYASDRVDDQYMKELTGLFRKYAQQYNMTRRETIDFVGSFVQQLPYTSDRVTTPYDEYPRFPLETLYEKGGDCEDTAILAATILKEMGYDVLLIAFKRHMGLGVACNECDGNSYEASGRKYYYLETTGEGWKVGALPSQYEEEHPRLFPLIPQPIIDAELSCRVIQEAGGYKVYEIEVSVKNGGSLEAKNVKIYNALGAEKQGMVYSQVQSNPMSIKPGEWVSAKVNLQAPRRVKTRALVAVYGDNFLSRSVFSDWFTTD